MIKDILGLEHGMTAVIGSGGKTSLIRRLAEELCTDDEDGRPEINSSKDSNLKENNIRENSTRDNHSKTQITTTVVCTTTHILRPNDMPVFETDAHSAFRSMQALEDFIAKNYGRPVCVGVTDPHDSKKLVSFPIEMIERAAGKNSFILIEADGAKHMLLKAHNDKEPVIPGNCERVILVIGAEGFGKPIETVVHRPEIFAQLAQVSTSEIVTPQLLAKVLLAEREKFGTGRLQVFVNRTEYPEQSSLGSMEHARQLAELTGWEVYAGCAREGTAVRC